MLKLGKRRAKRKTAIGNKSKSLGFKGGLLDIRMIRIVQIEKCEDAGHASINAPPKS
jgi:hypothetical protein